MAIWEQISDLRESCELFLDFPAPDSEADNADGQDDERVFRQQVIGAIAVLQSALNLVAAHNFGLYGVNPKGDK